MRALILVDIQNDFIPGGALAVTGGDAVVPVANRLQEKFDLVVATQDWHPEGHLSFAANHPGKSIGDVIDLDGLPQVLWPSHCVQDTPGAEFAPGLEMRRVEANFRKGTSPEIDSYSGFFDNGHRKATGVAGYLRERGVTEVALVGLATDYCVKFTGLDAIQQGFKVVLVEDGCRAVNLHPGDDQRALDELRAAGVRIVESSDL